MNKEKVITIVVGLLVGILAAGSYFAIVKILPGLKNRGDKIVIQPEIKTPVASTSAAISLTLEQPADNSSVTDSPIIVSGKTSPGIQIIIFGNAEEKIASASATGTFSAQLKLEDGENQISVTVLDDKPVTLKRAVTLEISP